ncbi:MULTISPECIES: DUF742 domain-containing protein [Streptosporangium]|jgi:hypothetical protein|uniref:DUF742 domain-containing protein n=2 Tax=Streptosporangium TaxID=2000 RepID=D2B0Y3_STRRD|nr:MULTISPECIES: DUF742 domain-containing protein [Streptosporangium]ACZ83390.1 hypothetical protein Sros_0358 [Streptosporangium roseum DSM 43021]OUC81177.1 hypothetical protein CA984_42165 [Streptosporangium minutum]
MSDDVEWVDEEAGPVVRPYALTGGRTSTSSAAFDLLSMVVATGSAVSASSHLGSEHRRLLGLMRRTRPIVEIASDVGLPIGVIRVLLGDLLDQGLILVRSPLPAATSPAESLLKEVISGLRAL